jgi:hypothetical protein
MMRRRVWREARGNKDDNELEYLKQKKRRPRYKKEAEI